MTGKELVNEIWSLGGNSQTVYPFQTEAIYEAIAQAMDEVDKLCPVKTTVQLIHYPLRPVSFQKGITVHKGGEDLKFNASDVRSLAFAVSGTGQAILSSPEAERSYTFSWSDSVGFSTLRGIMTELLGTDSADVELVFTGPYSYMIRDLSFYDELSGPLVEDVNTFSHWQEYRISAPKYLGDKFRGFDSLPVRFDNVDLNTPDDYKIEGESIYLPSHKIGLYEIKCRLKPRRIDEDNLDAELEIDPELHLLVPLRAAYYLYYLTDSEVADRCNAEYQRTLGIVVSKLHKVKTPSKFRDTRGW